MWEVDDGRTLANQIDKSFDVVVFLHSLDHLDDHEAVLKQAHRVAKKNVVIVLWRPFVINVGHHLNSKSVIANTQFRDSHLKEYNKTELDASITEAGFKILEDREVLDNDKRYSFFYLLEVI